MTGRSVALRGDAPPVVARLLSHPAALLFARVCVTAPFLWAGVYKLLNWPGGVAEMAGVGLHPAWVFNLSALATELGGSSLIILNRQVWLGAGALGVFTVLATLLAHRFWELSGAPRMMQLNSFLEHVTISATFILITVVASGQPARRDSPVGKATSPRIDPCESRTP